MHNPFEGWLLPELFWLPGGARRHGTGRDGEGVLGLFLFHFGQTQRLNRAGALEQARGGDPSPLERARPAHGARDSGGTEGWVFAGEMKVSVQLAYKVPVLGAPAPAAPRRSAGSGSACFQPPSRAVSSPCVFGASGALWGPVGSGSLPLFEGILELGVN